MSDDPGITPAELVRKYRTMLFDFARSGRRTIERELGRSPTCRPGCAFCCNAKVLISVADGMTIYLHLRETGRWTTAMEERLRRADQELTAASHAEWIAKARPCAFLKGEGPGRGRCTIYPARPVACAGTFSITDEPRSCGEPGGRAILTVVGPDLEEAFGNLHAQVLTSRGLPAHYCATLPGAVLCGEAIAHQSPLPPDVLVVSLEQARASGRLVDELFDCLGAARARRGAEL